ncbi:heterodisulfide reductase subunit A [candidate division KSB1 bacterium]|nr:MAG: heterodisulfide reductase subunit A [candidate division KSB1 bacterium]
MTNSVLKKENFGKLVDALLDAGWRVVAPVKEAKKTWFREIKSIDEMDWETLLPTNSPKEFLFPRTEPILQYRFSNNQVTVEDVDLESPKTAILGSRPCDAASSEILKSIFSWDYQESFFWERRNNIAFISIACKSPATTCFCTSVGLSPVSPVGSDILLTEIEPDVFLFEPLSPVGEEIAALIAQELGTTEAAEEKKREFTENALKDLKSRRALDKVKSWLDENFENPFWQSATEHCLGCGICTFLCPTCHCFDIVDESNYFKGERRKNWDSCQFANFTLHASGHNPREMRFKRYRQRIMHKFKYFPDRFDKILCVGCGRCIQYCPVNLDIYEILSTIQTMATTS